MKYTKKETDFVKNLIKKENMNVTGATKKMCESFNLTYTETMGRIFRRLMQKAGVTENVKTIEDTPEFQKAKIKEFDHSKQIFLISWCQNETAIKEEFLTNMEVYAENIDASIHIIAGRYKNPTSIESNKNLKYKEGKHSWNKRVVPYLDANRHRIHEFLTILSDIKTQPTASTPLSGFNGITGLESCIVGHPRVQMKSLPVLDGYPNKLLLTTGAVSVENHTDTKAGKKGEFHHQLGFVIVELDGDVFHVRQVTADKDGNFCDLFKKVENGVVSGIDSCKGIVFGDVHIGDHDEEAIKLSFEIAERLHPEVIVLHDIFNGTSVNGHEKKDPFQLLLREENNQWSLKKEVKEMKKWFSEHDQYNYVVVRSNHDEFLDRWLKNDDWRKSSNKLSYLKYATILAEGKAPKGIIPYVLEKSFDNVLCLGIDDSFRIEGWECGVHGHLGANGSKGSVVQFKNLNTKTITAHTHSPSREDGNVCVGTLTHLRVGYNQGISSWLQSNVIIHNNGKAQHVNIIKNKYTTLK